MKEREREIFMRSLAPRTMVSLVLTLLVVLAIGIALVGRTGFAAHAASTNNAHKSASASTFNLANFRTATIINNPYLPMTPGTEYIYQGSEGGLALLDTVKITRHTKNILGVPTVVVLDSVYLASQLSELTYDYYAQDAYGNVWYFGEYATQYQNGKVVGHTGSWIAGVNNAQAGITMQGNPHVGDTYRQEYSKGIAQDMAAVLSLTANLCVPYNCYFGNVLETRDFSPIEPGSAEHKWYALGVGTLKTQAIQGGTDQIQLVAIKQF
jgi:hypothetical protein